MSDKGNSTWNLEEQEKIREALEKIKDTDPEKYARIKESFERKLKTNIAPPEDFSLPKVDTSPFKNIKTSDKAKII